MTTDALRGNAGALWRSRRGRFAICCLVASLGLAALWAGWRVNGRSSAPSVGAAAFPLSPAIEERFGVRFTFLAVTAEGGLIDLRYRVVDEAKAKNFGHYTETSPMLIAEDSGLTVETTKLGLHNHRVEVGRVYYILFRNTANAIKPGSSVTIQVGDLLLEHVRAQ